MCVYDRFTMSDDEDVVYVRTELGGAGVPVEGASGGAPGDPVEETDDEAVVCSICFSSDVNVMLDCSHLFHDKCLVKYFYKKTTPGVDCPYCRQDVEEDTEFGVWAMVGPADLI